MTAKAAEQAKTLYARLASVETLGQLHSLALDQFAVHVDQPTELICQLYDQLAEAALSEAQSASTLRPGTTPATASTHVLARIRRHRPLTVSSHPGLEARRAPGRSPRRPSSGGRLCPASYGGRCKAEDVPGECACQSRFF